jgi:hypothetical protein
MLPELLLRSPDLLFCTEPDYFAKALEYYTTTYVALAYYIVAPKCYTTKAPVYYTTTCAASTHYIETSSITLLQLPHRDLNLYLLHHKSG